jgi:hypothetical protein
MTEGNESEKGSNLATICQQVCFSWQVNVVVNLIILCHNKDYVQNDINHRFVPAIQILLKTTVVHSILSL